MIKLPITEMFKTWQGEGQHAFREMFFVRLSGCNQSCEFCDTNHGLNEVTPRLTPQEIAKAATLSGCKDVCITGGEPCIHAEGLQKLVNWLKQGGMRVSLETNGTLPWPLGVDWITVSPKGNALKENVRFCSEIKVVIPHEEDWCKEFANHPRKYVQPADEKGPGEYLERIGHNLGLCKPFLETGWKLSLQWHKHFGWR